MACDPSSGSCVSVVVWQGSFADFAANVSQINSANFQTGDFGTLTLDFSSIVQSIPPAVVSAMQAALSAISGFVSLVVNGASATIFAQSTSPTFVLIALAIAAVLLAVGYALSQINVLVGKSVPSTPTNVICSILSPLGIDCGTATLIAYGVGAFFVYSLLFSGGRGGPSVSIYEGGTRRRRRRAT